MGSFRTTSVNPRPELLVNAGDGITLILNRDANNSIWLGDALGDFGGGGNTTELPAGGIVVVNGERPVYASTTEGLNLTANPVGIIPGGLNFFQLVKLLLKTLLINASIGNGLFVYSGTPAFGNLIAYIVGANGVDPFNNPVDAVLSVGPDNSQHLLVDVSGTSVWTDVNANVRVAIYTGASGIGNPRLVLRNQFNAILANMNSGPTPGNSGPNADGLFFYQDLGSATQGNLIGAFTYEANATDPEKVNTLTAAGFTGNITAQTVGGQGQESWHNLPLNAGVFQAFAGFHTPRYQLEGINGTRVKLSGVAQAIGNQVAGTLIGTLPAGYRPTAKVIGAVIGANGGFQIDTNGLVTCTQAVTGGNGVGFDGQGFELD